MQSSISSEEIINGLFAVLVERIALRDDPAETAEGVIQALRANFIGAPGGCTDA